MARLGAPAAISCLLLIAPGAACAEQKSTIFVETFDEPLDTGWRWVGENGDGWRLSGGRLLIHTHAGGIHADDESLRNLLIRELPQTGPSLCVDVDVTNRPAGLYENAGLILYVDNSNYVVVNKESFVGHRDPPVALQVVSEVDGAFYDEDQNVSYDQHTPVSLRLRVDEETVTGFYRQAQRGPWLMIGAIRRPMAARLWVGIETSYGVAGADRWAEFDNFKIVVGCKKD